VPPQNKIYRNIERLNYQEVSIKKIPKMRIAFCFNKIWTKTLNQGYNIKEVTISRLEKEHNLSFSLAKIMF